MGGKLIAYFNDWSHHVVTTGMPLLLWMPPSSLLGVILTLANTSAHMLGYSSTKLLCPASFLYANSWGQFAIFVVLRVVHSLSSQSVRLLRVKSVRQSQLSVGTGLSGHLVKHQPTKGSLFSIFL